MNQRTLLLIGGTGAISSAVAAEAISHGWKVTILTRGQNALRPPHPEAEKIFADVRDADRIDDALAERRFEVVIDFVAFVPEHVREDVELFRRRADHYIFISSASAYQKPVVQLPITESTPLRNPFYQYSRDKIACEGALIDEYRETGFPVTIVRPSHTYDAIRLPLFGGWTAFDRLLRGAPSVVHGDGTSLWVMTHARDFARGLVGLLGRPEVVGHAVHITSDYLLTWNAIYGIVADALGVEPNIVHVTSDVIAEEGDAFAIGSHYGDRSNSVVFDNTKLKRLVPGFTATIPFTVGAREMVEWYEAHPEMKVVDPAMDAFLDRLAARARGH